MKQIVVIVAALFAGFVGGVLGTRMSHIREQDPPQVIRARGFELVDEAGQAISFWGVDTGKNAILAFGSRGLAGGRSLTGHISPELTNPHNQLTAIGLQGNDSPMLKMSAADGKTRVRLLLSIDGKPTLSMEDETGPRVSLGIEQSDTPGPDDNDWSLLFSPERARVGMFTEKTGGQKYVRGVFLVDRGKVKYPYQHP